MYINVYVKYNITQWRSQGAVGVVTPPFFVIRNSSEPYNHIFNHIMLLFFLLYYFVYYDTRYQR